MDKKKDWYEEWFNTPYYHILYQDRDLREAELFIDNLFEKLRMQPGEKVLDLACGKGRHSIYLNRKGLDVVGADLSTENIREARKFENSTLHFKVHDMRKKIRSAHYDYIFNLFTSFGYFDSDEENIQTLKSVHEGLKPGGEFVIDFLNSNKTIGELNKEEDKEIGGIKFHVKRDLREGFIYKNISFEHDGAEHSFEERVMAISREMFEKYFDELGFRIIETYGDYDLGEFHEKESDRLIFRLQK